MAENAVRKVISPYERRLKRARLLAERHPEAAELLAFYLDVAALQKHIFENLDSSDVAALLPRFPELLEIAARFAPALAAFARENLARPEPRLDLLTAHWEGHAAALDPRANFFAHALLEPFAMRLAARGAIDPQWIEPSCPFCGSPPAAAVLRGEGDGAKRSLLCSLCATEWNFRRILCPHCGEADKEKLPVYRAAAFEHVRIEACDTCKTYLKAIDLTKDGLADPVVDEIASLALNLWAEEHGYTKLAPNALGM